MNLNNFRQYIDDIIYYRGHSYYLEGNVAKIIKTGNHCYTATVVGSWDYTVTVDMNKNMDIVHIDCDCPYDGEYCKHEVAVLLELSDRYRNPGSIHESKEEPIVDLPAVLKLKTKNQLISIINDVVSEFEDAKKFVEMNYVDLTDEQELRFAEKAIQQSILYNTDRNGFVHTKNLFSAIEGARSVIERAKRVLSDEKHLVATKLLICVIDEMIDLSMHSEDEEEGWIQQEIDEAFRILSDAANKTVLHDKQVRYDIFDMLFENAVKKRSSARHISIEYLKLCIDLHDLPEQLDEIWNCFDDFDLPNGKGYELKHSVINRLFGKEQAIAFLEENLDQREFREKLYDIMFLDGNYEKCVKIAMEGERNPNRFMNTLWSERIVDAFEMTGQIDMFKEYLLSRVMDGDIKVFYDKLKYYHDPDTWQPVYLSILDHYEKQDKNMDSKYISILVMENEKKRLLNFIKLNPSYFKDYYKYLLPEYSDDVYMLFTVEIFELAEDANKKSDYYTIQNLINRLKNAGGNEQAKDIVYILKDKFRHKRLFMSILNEI